MKLGDFHSVKLTASLPLKMDGNFGRRFFRLPTFGAFDGLFFFQGRTVGFSEVHRGVIKLWSHFLGEIKLLLQIYAGNFEEFP